MSRQQYIEWHGKRGEIQKRRETEEFDRRRMEESDKDEEERDLNEEEIYNAIKS